MPAPKNVVDYIKKINRLVSKSARRTARRDNEFGGSSNESMQSFRLAERLRKERANVLNDMDDHYRDRYIRECMESTGKPEYTCRRLYYANPMDKVNILDQLIELDPVDFMEANSNYVRRKANRLITGEED